LTFNEEALNQAISSMGLPIWHKSRPESVVWLVINNGNSQKILGAEDENAAAYQAVQKAAQQRGLPVFFPANGFTRPTSSPFCPICVTNR